MLVFIDESGDPGINAGSPYLILAMAIFRNKQDANHIRTVIGDFRKNGYHKAEFKFSKTRSDIRDAFFGAVMQGNFHVRAVCMDMRPPMPDPELAGVLTPEDMYQQALLRLLDHAGLMDAHIAIDNRSSTTIAHLRAQKDVQNDRRPGAITEIVTRDSGEDNLIQLADMVAGAVARAFYPYKTNHDRWLGMLGLTIEDIDRIP